MGSKTERDRQTQKKASYTERAEKHESGFSGTSFKLPEDVSLFTFKKEGSYKIDILPYTTGKGNPFAQEKGLSYCERTFYVHRGVGPDEKSYCCLRKCFNKACPICDDRARLAKKTDSDEDLIKALAPKERQLWVIYNRTSDKDKEKGVQVLESSFWLFGKQLDAKIKNSDEDDGYRDFWDAEKGLTLRLGVEEEKNGGYTFYKVTDIEFKPRVKELDEELVNHGICLDELLVEMEYDDLKKIYLQTEEDDDDDDDKPKKKSSKKDDDDDDAPKKKKPADDDDDDKPVKKKPRDDDDDDRPAKKAAAKDEDDDDRPAKKKPKEDDDDAPGKPITAKDAGIDLGDIVKHKKHGECEVVHVSADGTAVRLEDEEGELHKAIGVDECKLLRKAKKKAPKEEEDDDKPAKKKPKDEDDDDVPKKKKPADDDDDDDAPRASKKGAKRDDDDDD